MVSRLKTRSNDQVRALAQLWPPKWIITWSELDGYEDVNTLAEYVYAQVSLHVHLLYNVHLQPTCSLWKKFEKQKRFPTKKSWVPRTQDYKKKQLFAGSHKGTSRAQTWEVVWQAQCEFIPKSSTIFTLKIWKYLVVNNNNYIYIHFM